MTSREGLPEDLNRILARERKSDEELFNAIFCDMCRIFAYDDALMATGYYARLIDICNHEDAVEQAITLTLKYS